MKDNPIQHALTQARSEALLEIQKNPDDRRAIWARLSPDAVAPIVDALRSIPVIAQLEGKYCIVPQGYIEFDFERLSGFLVERALTFDPDVIADDLLRLITERTYTWVEVRFVEYLQIDDVIEFGDGFSAIPIDQFPDQYAPMASSSSLFRFTNSLTLEQMTQLVRERTLILNVSDKLPDDDGILSHETPQADWDALLNAVIIASKGAPKWGVQYQFAKDAGWVGMTRNGAGRGDSHFGPVDTVKDIDLKTAKASFRLLRNAPPGLLLALRLLAKSRRRRFEPTEKVIDLGTCAEVLLMNKSKDNNEISMKVGLRAAWFLNGGADQRVLTFKTLRELYRLRSISVHTGEMPTIRGIEKYKKQRECIEESDKLLTAILIKMLQEGIPKDSQWSSIVLGAT